MTYLPSLVAISQMVPSLRVLTTKIYWTNTAGVRSTKITRTSYSRGLGEVLDLS